MASLRKSRASCSVARALWQQLGGGLLVLALWAFLPAIAAAMAPGMRGPRPPLVGAPFTSRAEPAGASRQALMTPIRWFQTYVSPIDGPRCQFHPTCSAFGYAAVRDHGVWHGTLMTTDRLLRCSHLTEPNAYPRRSDGRLVDPVAANLLEE